MAQKLKKTFKKYLDFFKEKRSFFHRDMHNNARINSKHGTVIDTRRVVEAD